MFIELISKPPTPRCKKIHFCGSSKYFSTHNLTKSIIFHTAGLSFLFYIFAVFKILLIELRSHPPCWYHPNPLGEDAYYSHCCKTLTDENIGVFHSAMTCVVQETLNRKHREKVQFCRIIQSVIMGCLYFVQNIKRNTFLIVEISTQFKTKPLSSHQGNVLIFVVVCIEIFAIVEIST